MGREGEDPLDLPPTRKKFPSYATALFHTHVYEIVDPQNSLVTSHCINIAALEVLTSNLTLAVAHNPSQLSRLTVRL